MGDLTLHHPLTGNPIVPLGYRKNGRAIWPIMGGDDTVTPADPPPSDAPSAEAPKDPAPADPKTSDTGPKGGADALRADLASERDKRQGLESQVQQLQTTQQQQMDAIAKALGLKKDDEPVDPEKLTADVSAAQADARAARQQLAVYQAAATLEANAAELLDSTSFLASIKDVDPNDAAAVSAAIKTAVDSNAKFKLNAAPPTAPSFGGGPRTPAPTKAGTLDDAVVGHYQQSR